MFWIPVSVCWLSPSLWARPVKGLDVRTFARSPQVERVARHVQSWGMAQLAMDRGARCARRGRDGRLVLFLYIARTSENAVVLWPHQKSSTPAIGPTPARVGTIGIRAGLRGRRDGGGSVPYGGRSNTPPPPVALPHAASRPNRAADHRQAHCQGGQRHRPVPDAQPHQL